MFNRRLLVDSGDTSGNGTYSLLGGDENDTSFVFVGAGQSDIFNDGYSPL